MSSLYILFFFFFQAEDGIRDYKVTGVQTCALPISLIATFSTNTGTGSATVRVDPENEQYVVNWKTGQFGLDTAKTYRIRVLLGSTELGHADVDVVATGRERKSVDATQFVPVVNGQTLPITFRIEDGAILALALGAMRTWYNTSQGGAGV